MIAPAHVPAKPALGRDPRVVPGSPTRHAPNNKTSREARLKGIVRLLICAVALGVAATASAQTYPDRNVRVLVPFGQGGPTDVIARVFAAKLSENLGHSFYVENVPGAGGNLGTAQAARAAGDGYTI